MPIRERDPQSTALIAGDRVCRRATADEGVRRRGKALDCVKRARRLLRRAGHAGISVCLLASIGSLPLVQSLHVVLADHDHRYCAEHNRIEDVSRPSEGLGVAESDGAPAVRPPDASPHTPCAVLNVDIPRKPALVCTGTFSVCAAPVTIRVPMPSAPPRASANLILLAPKNSPPAFAA